MMVSMTMVRAMTMPGDGMMTGIMMVVMVVAITW